MGPTFLFALEGKLGIVVHGVLGPSDAEWLAYLRDATTLLGKVTGGLIFTDGGGPDGRQRALLAQHFPELAPLPTAVVSASPATRGIVTALRWFGKNIRSFEPAELASAFDYLRVPADERLAAQRCAARLRAELVRRGGAVSSSDEGDITARLEWVVAERLAKVVARRSGFPQTRHK